MVEKDEEHRLVGQEKGVFPGILADELLAGQPQGLGEALGRRGPCCASTPSRTNSKIRAAWRGSAIRGRGLA